MLFFGETREKKENEEKKREVFIDEKEGRIQRAASIPKIQINVEEQGIDQNVKMIFKKKKN